MKDFIKMTLAVICGCVILTVLCIVLGAGFISTVASMGNQTVVVPKSAVLNLDMGEISLAEQSMEANPLESIQTVKQPSLSIIGIWDAVRAINIAAEDNSVKFIFLRPENVQGGMAQIYELRQALEHFRASGKAVVAYMDNVTTAGYYLATVADKVYLTSYEGGTSMFHGVCGQLFFLKDILDKLGVNVQLIRHGKYKSAGEMFVKNSPSPENLEQNQVMISSIWDEYAETMAGSRNISVEKLNELVDGLKLNFPQDFFDASLVDGLLSREQLKEKLATLSEVEKYKDVKMVSLQDYISARVVPNYKAKNKIAVIYADGEIVDGHDRKDVAGDYFASVISKVRADSTVKAVVFRVNSPGGSVLASEKIKAEVDLLKEVKPVVASYGDYAASGGYWISANCNHIFADPVTLTGSIGVFSMIPDFSKTVKDIAHVTYTPVKSNSHSDILSLMRPLDADETEYMQDAVENIYDRFVGIVADGRGVTPDFVDSIAQGRVWTGRDAIGIHLVDEIGTLEDAINWAVSSVSTGIEDSDLNNWDITPYPKPQTTMEIMFEMIGKPSEEEIFSGTVLEPVARSLSRWAGTIENGSRSVMLARMPFEISWNQ